MYKNNNKEEDNEKIDDEEAYINCHHTPHLPSQNNKGYASFTIVHEGKEE